MSLNRLSRILMKYIGMVCVPTLARKITSSHPNVTLPQPHTQR